ncbi:MAG: metallophosphoesterase [Nanoarchaeota archaeon]
MPRAEKPESEDYEFIGKNLFFPKHGILVFGDMHIGYETMLRQSGILVPERQVKDIIEEVKKVLGIIKKKGHETKKIVFLGDLKHAFGFNYSEKNEFQEVFEFLGEIFPQENIILIKGNHDTIDYTFEGMMKKFHIEKNIAFIHGDRKIKEAFNPEIKFVVHGHLHPCLILAESPKQEAFKCFLVGKHKNKTFIVMPSYLDIIEGTPVNEYEENYVESFSVVPKKDIMHFKIHAIGSNKIYDFGEIRDFN